MVHKRCAYVTREMLLSNVNIRDIVCFVSWVIECKYIWGAGGVGGGGMQGEEGSDH